MRLNDERLEVLGRFDGIEKRLQALELRRERIEQLDTRMRTIEEPCLRQLPGGQLQGRVAKVDRWLAARCHCTRRVLAGYGNGTRTLLVPTSCQRSTSTAAVH